MTTPVVYGYQHVNGVNLGIALGVTAATLLLVVLYMACAVYRRRHSVDQYAEDKLARVLATTAAMTPRLNACAGTPPASKILEQ